jgi:hypothetical protein
MYIRAMLNEVRSLRRNAPLDGAAWCVGTDWWLSTEAPQSGE